MQRLPGPPGAGERETRRRIHLDIKARLSEAQNPPKIRWVVSTEGGLLRPEAWSLNDADLRRRLRGIMDLSDVGRGWPGEVVS